MNKIFFVIIITTFLGCSQKIFLGKINLSHSWEGGSVYSDSVELKYSKKDGNNVVLFLCNSELVYPDSFNHLNEKSYGGEDIKISSGRKNVLKTTFVLPDKWLRAPDEWSIYELYFSFDSLEYDKKISIENNQNVFSIFHSFVAPKLQFRAIAKSGFITLDKTKNDTIEINLDVIYEGYDKFKINQSYSGRKHNFKIFGNFFIEKLKQYK